jgi:hypothetical protein
VEGDPGDPERTGDDGPFVRHRESRLAELTRDWGEDFALLEAAFPGRKPTSYTIAVFEHRLACAAAIISKLHAFSFEAVDKREVHGKDNRTAIIKERIFKRYYRNG